VNKFIDLTGKVFGERTVLRFSHQHPTSRNLYWVTRCKEGHESTTSGTRLRSGSGCPSCASKINGRKGLYTQAEERTVYFIQCGDYIKIGVSKDPEKRRKSMETSNPYPLTLLKVDKENSEEYWHEVFKEFHHRGEWYKMTPEQLTDIGG
jgi:hypothetical protein